MVQEFIEKLNGDNSSETSTSDSLCLTQLIHLFHEAASNELWALKVVDAWSKLNSGLFSGNLANFGHFEQCIKMNHDLGDNGIFQGQHCMTTFEGKEGVVRNSSASGFDLSKV